MRNSPVFFIERSALEALPTKALLGRLQRLRECEEAPEASDMTKQDIAAAPGILFKQSLEWSVAYSDVKAVLATREHLPQVPSRRAHRADVDNRSTRKRRIPR